MPLTGAIPEGRSFFCPHCGALYAVTYSRLSDSDSNVGKCVVCGQIMDKWDSIKAPSFKLIRVVRQPNGYPIPPTPLPFGFTLGLRIPIPR
jgi:hypothetical protein